MATRWKKSFRNEICRSTSIGKFVLSNGITLEDSFNYNGSGKDSFGGNEKWPAIRLKISMPNGQEFAKRDLIKRLKALTDQWIIDHNIMEH